MRRVKNLFLVILTICLFAAGPAAGRCEDTYSLDDLYQLALKNSERVKITEENIRIAEAGKDKAVAGLLPRLSAFGGYIAYTDDKYAMTASGPTVTQPDGAKSWGVKLDQTLYMNGREFMNLAISRENLQKSRYDLDSVREDYLLSVSFAFYDVLKAKKALEIADANLERLRKYRDAAATRLRIGEVTKTVLLRAEGEHSGALSDQIKAGNALALAKAVLARVAGISGDYSLKEPYQEEVKMASLNELQETAAANRSELKSLELQKKITEDQVRSAKSGFWPTVTVTAGYTGQDQSPMPATLVKDSTYGSVSLNYPFFEGGLRRAEVNEAKTKQRQAELAYRDILKSVQIDVQNAYLDLATQKGIVKFLQDQLVFARDNFNAVSKQFDYGLAHSIDVIDANNLLLSAQRQLADATYNYHLSILKLKRATGKLLETAGRTS
jgi:outer membrane protein